MNHDDPCRPNLPEPVPPPEEVRNLFHRLMRLLAAEVVRLVSRPQDTRRPQDEVPKEPESGDADRRPPG
jgi:hypothetical protein